MAVKNLQGYISIREAALKLGLSKERVRRLIVLEEIAPVFRVDNFYVIPEKSLLKFIKSREGNTDWRTKVK